MSKLSSAFVRSLASSARPYIRWGAVALTAVLLLQASIYYGNQQHLKHSYVAVHASQVLPHTTGSGTAVGTPGVISFDAPGASTVSLQGTIADGIDAAGDVGGVWIDTRGVRHGFVRTAAGVLSTFDAPGAGTNQRQYDYGQGTIPLSMDSAGDIAGFYGDANGAYHGFIRSAAGTITAIDEPSENTQGGLGTIVTGINVSGVVTGYYLDGTNYITHGFVRTAAGAFTSFDAPDALCQYCYSGTQALSINAEGDVTGTYTSVNGGRHGFVRIAATGTLTEFDEPNANIGTLYGKDAQGTIAVGIDAGGDISGVYSDSNNLSHGFVRTASGTYTSFDEPNAGKTASAFVGIGLTIPGSGGVGINATGTIVGTYEDASSVAHGFTRTASGTFASFDAPGAGTGAGGFVGTGGIAINPTGAVAGTYMDANSVLHAFVYASTATVSVTSSSTLTSAQTLPVTVAVSSPGAVPTGTVTLTSGTYTSAATTLTSGSAVITVPAGVLAAGSDTLTATYTPDSASSSIYSSTSGSKSVTLTVAAVTTTLTLTTNPSTTTYLQQVALTATLSPYTNLYGNTTSEPVTFYNGSTSLGTANLTSGVATLNVTSLPAGPASLKAVYGGDVNFATSTSNIVSYSVQQDFTLTPSGSTSQTVTGNGSVSYTFPITPSSGTTFPAAVTFTASGLPAGATATFNPASLPAGSSATNVVMTVQVTQTAMLEKTKRPGQNLPLVVLAVLLLPFAGKMRRSGKRLKHLTSLMLLLIAGGTLAMLSGCSGGGGSSSTGTSIKGTYTVVVTATTAGVSHSSNVTLIVQ